MEGYVSKLVGTVYTRKKESAVRQPVRCLHRYVEDMKEGREGIAHQESHTHTHIHTQTYVYAVQGRYREGRVGEGLSASQPTSQPPTALVRSSKSLVEGRCACLPACLPALVVWESSRASLSMAVSVCVGVGCPPSLPRSCSSLSGRLANEPASQPVSV